LTDQQLFIAFNAVWIILLIALIGAKEWLARQDASYSVHDTLGGYEVVQVKKGSLATRGSVSVSRPNTTSIPKKTTVSSSRFNKHKGK
jgi:hypothetical protein